MELMLIVMTTNSGLRTRQQKLKLPFIRASQRVTLHLYEATLCNVSYFKSLKESKSDGQLLSKMRQVVEE